MKKDVNGLKDLELENGPELEIPVIEESTESAAGSVLGDFIKAETLKPAFDLLYDFLEEKFNGKVDSKKRTASLNSTYLLIKDVKVVTNNLPVVNFVIVHLGILFSLSQQKKENKTNVSSNIRAEENRKDNATEKGIDSEN